MRDELDLFQGTLDLLILKSLIWGERHGYAVARWIAETTRDDLQVEEGALYTALHRLHKKKWVAADWGVSDNNRKAKFYSLTPLGKRQLTSQVDTWQRYARAVSRVIQATA